jgi:hypothetical protein
MRNLRVLLSVALLVSAASAARADRQRIAPGTGSQSAVAIDTGANGICQTAAQGDDVQAAAVGQGTAFQPVVRCGADRTASTAAAGDDGQLVAVGGTCQNPNVVVVDSGSDGIANTTALGDDRQDLAVGSSPPNTACVVTGANGIADTSDPVGGDDVRLVPAGTAAPNTQVVRCGPNLIADTRANNVNAAGDDVQLVAQYGPCANANTVVVDSGANGIADTRAEGPDLTLQIAKPLKLTIKRKKGVATKAVKLVTRNVEWGPTATVARNYLLFATDGSCPNGTVTQVDADARTPGLQATATVSRGGQMKGTFLVSFRLEDVTIVDKKIPYRCAVQVEARALDTSPDPDDAANTDNNETDVVIEVIDQSDLPRK